MSHALALGLVAAGTGVIVASALGSHLAGPDGLARVHFLTPVTSLGAPLVCAGVCVAQGWGLTSGEDILVVGLLFVAGPVMSAATGRVIAQHEGLLGSTGPE